MFIPAAPIPPYDPADPAQRDDPYPLFARLQDEDPVHWSPALRAWVLTRYDDVREAMNTDALSPDRLRPFYAALKDERRDVLAEVMRYLSLWMVFRDPPEHTRLRRLMGGVFTPRAIEQLAPAITAVVDELLDPLDDARRRGDAVDWVRAVAMPLPAYVILDLLGVPRAHYAAVKAWSDELRAFIGSARADGDRYARARRGAEGMAGFFRGLIAQRRAAPGSDFISRLIAIVVGMAALFLRLPTSFLPDEDQGVMFAMVQLPAGATLQRTEKVLEQVQDRSCLRPVAGLGKSRKPVGSISTLTLGRGGNHRVSPRAQKSIRCICPNSPRRTSRR